VLSYVSLLWCEFASSTVLDFSYGRVAAQNSFLDDEQKNNAMDRTVLTYQCDMDTGAGVNVRLVCVSMFWQNFWGYTLRVSMSDSFVCLCFGRIFGDTLVWFFKSLSHRMFGCQF